MNKSHREYIHRINKVIDYIEANLNGDLRLETLAQIANFSIFHFHRIFSVFKGETLNAFVKRKRVEKAGSLLMTYKEKSISEISEQAGFSSVSVFCRSFKSHFKMSAQEFRENWVPKNSKNGQLQSKNSKSNADQAKYVCSVETLKNIQMKNQIEVKQMPAFKVIYTRHIGEYDQIGTVYEKLYKWAGARELINEDTRMMTIYHDDPKVTEQSKNQQSACLIIDQDIKAEGEFGNLDVAAGKFAVGRFEIGMHEFKAAWDGVFLWISENGFQPDDFAPYEIYYNNKDQHPEQKFIVDICIPVKPMEY